MMILNLGCGCRTSDHPKVINIDWSFYFLLKNFRFPQSLASHVLGSARAERYRSIKGTVLLRDLRRRLPFGTESIDAVYHSHMIEHIDRELVPDLLSENFRVLRPDGILRVVTPDASDICRRYLENYQTCLLNSSDGESHDKVIEELIEQSVRKEAAGVRGKGSVARAVETFLLGDARRRGETHQWLYDQVNLGWLMSQAGFIQIRVLDHVTSSIPSWVAIGLDQLKDGSPYKPGSLYMEGTKPAII